jgi:hypothetical protein
MSRHLLFVLLLATCVALAAERSQAQHSAGAAKTQTKAEETQGQPEHAQAEGQAENAQEKTEVAKRRTEHPQGQGETEQAQVKTDEDTKLISVPGGKALGMSILGNQDAPKSLVIVPWKSSELGRSPGISPMLDDSRQPVDKEVFIRALSYYEIRSGTKP